MAMGFNRDGTADNNLVYAIERIKADYGDTVSVSEKNKQLLKFGRNLLVGTSAATIMDLPAGILHETYVSGNDITTVSSSSGSDTRQITIEGHTISGSDLTFVVQTITLTGQTQATLTTPLHRCTRLYADNTSTTELVGNIYVYENDTSTGGVPDTDAKVHLTLPAGEQQSRKASTSLSSVDYWIVTGFDADCYKKSAGFAEVRLEVREPGGVFRQKEAVAVESGAHSTHDFKPYIIIPPNSDVRLTGVASAASTDVGGMIQGYLAIIT